MARLQKLKDLIQEVYKSKSIGRILLNWKIKERCKDITGRVLDLGAGSNASYQRYLPANIDLISTDITGDCERVIKADLNEVLPFANESFSTIFLFNSIYILEDRIKTLTEVRRVLATGGTLFLSSPFIYPEIPEPHDYCRLSFEGLEKELKVAGFEDIKIDRLGARATAAVSLLYPFLLFNTVRLMFYILALGLDKLTVRRDWRHPVPLIYFCSAKK